jgi:hypothetical protein
MKVMKAINFITPEKTGTASLKQNKSIKCISCRMSKYLISFFLAIFLLTIVVPVDASTGSGKNKKSGCRVKRTTFSYPVIISKNKPMVYNKNLKKTKVRNYSFPV